MAGLAAAIMLAVCGAATAFAEAPQAEAARASASRPLVFLITWRGCEQACRGFHDYVARMKLPVEVVERDAGQDRRAIGGLVDEARARRAAAIVTWGNDVTYEVVGPYDAVDPARHVTDIPVVYMYVSGAVEGKISRGEDATGRPNIAGTDYVVPLSAQINAINAYRPSRRIGMLYDPAQEGSVQRMEAIRDLAPRMDFTLIAVPLPLGATGRPDAARLAEAMDTLAAQQPDFVYFGLSSFLIQQVKPFTALALERGLPVFSGGQLPVEQADALLGLFTRLDQIGALAGSQVESILTQNIAPGEMPIARLNRFTLMVNMSVARTLEVYPPISIVRVADFIKVEQ
ncbi:ABC transporter substrate binding protein [Arenibaculum pallidiluteum]|uniref:ABC transporter substrate binding protein n=1 Tax=Arenibaculum pallidiluteum TaxID=2812559 RepID=UPI001A969CE3|nr:ABC transporter substrate binding protein [Arenibaculum pallidiluteum]